MTNSKKDYTSIESLLQGTISCVYSVNKNTKHEILFSMNPVIVNAIEYIGRNEAEDGVGELKQIACGHWIEEQSVRDALDEIIDYCWKCIDEEAEP